MNADDRSALTLAGISRDIHGRPVLRDLHLTAPYGAYTALVGLNGAGKTTALRIALGMLRPDRGTVRLHSSDAAGADRRVWGDVGHLVEAPHSYPELTARANIEASAQLHGHRGPRLDASLAQLADELRFTTALDTPVRRLSLGTRHKVALASALVHRPRLVILDEPTNGLDPLAVVALRRLLDDATRAGTAVLVTSHHFDELARVADRVAVLHRGHVIDTLTPDRAHDLEAQFFATLVAADEAHLPACDRSPR